MTDDEVTCKMPVDWMPPPVIAHPMIEMLLPFVTEPPMFNSWMLLLVPAANTNGLPVIVITFVVTPPGRQPLIVVLCVMTGNDDTKPTVPPLAN
jgi:hypothetical protein